MMKSIALFNNDIESSWPKTYAVVGFNNANPVALLNGTQSINLAKIFLFVMLRCYAKAACNDNVYDTVDSR